MLKQEVSFFKRRKFDNQFGI
jgi:hypothetical protein